jgi:hypothetical protein
LPIFQTVFNGPAAFPKLNGSTGRERTLEDEDGWFGDYSNLTSSKLMRPLPPEASIRQICAEWECVVITSP